MCSESVAKERELSTKVSGRQSHRTRALSKSNDICYNITVRDSARNHRTVTALDVIPTSFV